MVIDMVSHNQVDNDIIASIQSSNDIVDVVGEYVQLKKQGRNYFGLCPFHSENTPSFSVNQEKQIFHCFGCGKGGNVFTFMMEIEGYSFPQSVQHLAEKSGQQITLSNQSNETKESNSEEQKILEAYQLLSKLYHHLLKHTKDGKKGLEYLYDRGFNEETIDKFQLGFSPYKKDFIMQFLEQKGYHRQLMIKSGFFTTNHQDRFQGRIVFPIRNITGKTIGFVGRSIDDQEPKYLNSAESPLFQKSKILYNFDQARSEIRKKSEVILTEGSADVMALAQAGFENTVASLGTSFTDTHASILRRYVDTVILCFDGDNAGQQATFKTLKILKKVGCFVKIAMLPTNYDPDQYIKEYGADSFDKHIIQTASTEMSFLMKYYKNDFDLRQEGELLRYVDKIISEIALLASPIDRDFYIRELAEQFSLSHDALTEELSRKMQFVKKNDDNKSNFGNTNEENQYSTNNNKKKVLQRAYLNAERTLLAFMLQNAQIADRVKDKIGSKFNLEQHQIIVTYLYGFYEEGNEPNPSHFLTYIEDQAIQKIVVDLSLLDCNWDISEKELEDYIHIILAEQTGHAKIKQLNNELHAVEKTDPLRAAEIAMEINKIRQQLKRGS